MTVLQQSENEAQQDSVRAQIMSFFDKINGPLVG